MKVLIFLGTIFFVFNLFQLNAQNVGINSTGSAPASSAGLDVDFTNKGLLPPRVADTNAVSSPAEGLQIYDISSHCMRYGTNLRWSSCMGMFPLGTLSTLNCAGAVVSSSPCALLPVSGVTVSIPYSGASSGYYDSQSINSTGVIGLQAFLPSGTFSSSGTGSLGFTISGTPTSSGTASFLVNIGGQSCSFTISIGAAPGVPMALSASSINYGSFNANWLASINATGYFLDVATDAGFTNMVAGYNNLSVGNVLTYSVNGLSLGTTYYYRVRANSSCGTSSNSSSISLTTLNILGCSPGQPATAYGTVTGVPGAPTLTWITRNLGATVQASSSSDNSIAAAGCYWQFGEIQAYGVNGTTNGASSANPAWDMTLPPAGSWTVSQDPCRQLLGGTWRIPTNAEWTAVDATPNWGTVNDAFGSALKLHAAGNVSGGTLSNRGATGFFWTSNDQAANSAFYLHANFSLCYITTNVKNNGFSIRCVY